LANIKLEGGGGVCLRQVGNHIQNTVELHLSGLIEPSGFAENPDNWIFLWK